MGLKMFLILLLSSFLVQVIYRLDLPSNPKKPKLQKMYLQTKFCIKTLTMIHNPSSTPPLNRAHVEKKCLTLISMAFFMSDQRNLEYVKMKMIP